MANIFITDEVALALNLHISDDAPLALGSLKNLKLSNLPVVADFNKPVDQFPLPEVQLGLGLNAVAALLDKDMDVVLGGGASGLLTVRSHKQGALFGDDQFAPALAVGEGECWLGLTIGFTLTQNATLSSTGVVLGPVKVPPTGFGVSLETSEGVAAGTYLRLPVTGTALPTFKDGLSELLQTYALPVSAEKLRSMPAGVAHTAEMNGSVMVGASYAAPLLVNPFATLNAPLNLTLNVEPNVGAMVEGSVKLEGTFVVRAYRSAETKMIFGLYKKRKTSVTASLSAMAGVGVDSGVTDLLAKVLKAVVPAADLSGLQLDDGQRDELRRALKACVDESVSLAVNAGCTAAESDEAALVYELDVSSGDMTATDAAIASALRSDWSKFEALPNARVIRNVVRELHERNHKLNINLLGLYNATTMAEYVKSSTVVHDEHGQIAMVDQAEAKRLSAGTTPYAAKADKLRGALAQAFVATVAYGASRGKLGMRDFTVRQSMLEYRAEASATDIKSQVLLARTVGLRLNSHWDELSSWAGAFQHSKFYLDAVYDARSVLHLFYQDVHKRTPHSADALDRLGRDTKIALLDPQATNAGERRAALSDDAIWAEMTKRGNVAAFRTIAGLERLEATAVAAIGADYLDIRWWSEAMESVTPKLSSVLAAIDHSASGNPLTDAAFMTAHKQLENALANLTANTRSAFKDGWDIAVMCRLGNSLPGPGPSVQMDIGWNGKFEHYVSRELAQDGHAEAAGSR